MTLQVGGGPGLLEGRAILFYAHFKMADAYRESLRTIGSHAIIQYVVSPKIQVRIRFRVKIMENWG